MKYYYLLITDAIYTLKNGSYKHEWHFKLGYILFVMLFLNVNTFMILFDLDYNLFEVNISNGRRFNGRFNAFLHTGPLILILNYFLIFHKKKYELIEAKYPHSNKKLFATYTIVSMLLGFGTFFMQKWVKGLFIFWE